MRSIKLNSFKLSTRLNRLDIKMRPRPKGGMWLLDYAVSFVVLLSGAIFVGFVEISKGVYHEYSLVLLFLKSLVLLKSQRGYITNIGCLKSNLGRTILTDDDCVV
jgi:hypothetical protein